MQAYFEPEQAFSISMLQPVFEISIAYKKNMYAIPTIIFVHYKHHRWKTIKVSHYQHSPTSPFIARSAFIILAEIWQPPGLFYPQLLFETGENVYTPI